MLTSVQMWIFCDTSSCRNSLLRVKKRDPSPSHYESLRSRNGMIHMLCKYAIVQFIEQDQDEMVHMILHVYFLMGQVTEV